MQREIDPKTFKKHSQIVKQHKTIVAVTGVRERTETGYIIPGHSCGDFEIYFEMIMPSASSGLMTHPKKAKAIQVLDGTGAVIVNDITTKLLPGDQVVLPAGCRYRILTTNTYLSFFVTQGSKYAARLEVLEPANSKIDIPSELLTGISPQEKLNLVTVPTRRGSKAREQSIARATSARGNQRETAQPLSRIPDATGLNPMPTMGRFSEEGAG